MNGYDFTLCGAWLTALGSGALWWRDQSLLCVSDLHLGKSLRQARRHGAMLPPYEGRDTLLRLQTDLDLCGARSVVCLGDSFDDVEVAGDLPEEERLWIARLQAGRRWIWIAGNHDPGPLSLGGDHLAQVSLAGLTFRHVASPGTASQAKGAEVSGHYHPKAPVPTRSGIVTRPCFLVDATRLILPAYGTYTGGLRSTHPALCNLMRPDALAILTGARPMAVPMPR